MLILKAFVAGVLVAAPVGPVTVLVARAALRGEYMAVVGLACGVALADLLVATVISFGLRTLQAYVPFFLFQEHLAWIYVCIGLGVLAFALHVWHTPVVVARSSKKLSHIRGFLLAFFVTSLNPLTALGLIALFSFMHLVWPTSVWWHVMLLGVLFVGSCAWWGSFSLFVRRIARRSSHKALALVNKGFALVMMGSSFYALLRGAWMICLS